MGVLHRDIRAYTIRPYTCDYRQRCRILPARGTGGIPQFPTFPKTGGHAVPPENSSTLREMAGQRKRFGSTRLHIMLKREGLVINHKRTERIYREEGLALRRKRRRKGAAGLRVAMPLPDRTNHVGPWISLPTASSPGGVFAHWLSSMTIHGNAQP